MSKPIASLLVRIGADVSQLSAGSQQAIASMDRIAAKSVQVGKQLALLGAAAAAAGTAFATKLTREGLQFVDSQAKMARTVGATIDGLRGLQMAAEDAGIDNVTDQVQKMNARLGEAARRGGPAKEMLDGLGLSAQDLMAMDVDQRIATIADRVKELGLNSSEAGDMLRQFGVRNQQMINLMMDGGDAIRRTRQEVDDLGLSISEIDAAQIEAANDAMGVFADVMEGLRNKFAVALAPILLELSTRFENLVKANQGFGAQMAAAAETGIRAMAKVLDVLQGLRVAFKGLELIAVGVKAAFISSFQLAAEAIAKVAEGVRITINAVISGLNKLPKVDIATIDPFTQSAFMTGLRTMGEDARNEVGRVRTELHNLAMQELPSAKAEEFLEAVRARAQAAAEAVVGGRDNSGAFSGAFGEDDGGAGERAEREAERLRAEEAAYKESLANRLLSLQEYLMTDEELAVAKHERRLEELQAALDAELVQEQDAMALREELEQKHMDNLGEIQRRAGEQQKDWEDMNLRERVKMVGGHLADITAGVASHNRKMFELNKIAGIANAVVAAYEGIALTISKYPFPISVAMAAAQAAAAFAQVNAIKSASFGGSGGVAPSLAGGTPAPAVTPVTSGTPDGGGGRNIFIQGISPDSLVSGRQIAELLEEFIGDGGRVVFGP